MITLQQLEYITAVDKYRHFVTAAEHCFVTQPTLSMQIKKLEDHLGVIIFDRSKQPIIPTQLGEKIIQQAKEVLFETKKIEELIKNAENDISGSIHIGIIPSLAPYLLPRFIGAFTHNYPNLKVTVNEMLSEDIIKGLKNDDIDVGLLVTPLNEKGIFETPLFYEKMFLYINPSHSFSKAKTIKTTEIATDHLWLMSEGNCFRTQVINLCEYSNKLESNRHFKFDSGSLETIINLVDIEGGYTLLPELATKKLSESKGILKSFSNTTPLREVGLAFSRTNAKSKLLNLLADAIKKSVPQHMLKKDGEVVYWR
jgi:LysR family hydrogen peroxide-inducible transcriptional activator